MTEKLIFKNFRNTIGEMKLCIHFHYPKKRNEKAFLFLNPLFDEKKRTQKFQASTARELTDKGFTVVRFDFYGTGDSYGNFEELSIQTCLENGKSLLYFIREELNMTNISILGIRWGGTMAIELASTSVEIRNLILIDPIVSGKRYLTELRLRRKAFFMLNNMKNIKDREFVDGEYFEDHQGYLLSSYFIQELECFNLFNSSISVKNIILFSLDTINRKKMMKLTSYLNSKNKALLIPNNTRPFWNSLEMIKTDLLTDEILENV